MDHLDLARCCALIADEDLAAGIVALGGSLALLQVDLAKLAGHHDACLQSSPSLDDIPKVDQAWSTSPIFRG